MRPAIASFSLARYQQRASAASRLRPGSRSRVCGRRNDQARIRERAAQQLQAPRRDIDPLQRQLGSDFATTRQRDPVDRVQRVGAAAARRAPTPARASSTRSHAERHAHAGLSLVAAGTQAMTLPKPTRMSPLPSGNGV
jgi:hypothetical protein